MANWVLDLYDLVPVHKLREQTLGGLAVTYMYIKYTGNVVPHNLLLLHEPMNKSLPDLPVSVCARINFLGYGISSSTRKSAGCHGTLSTTYVSCADQSRSF